MKTAVVALTKNGSGLALRICTRLKADGYLKEKFMPKPAANSSTASVYPVGEEFQPFIGTLFCRYDAIVLIMACGIAVRSIAPFLKGKTVDPAVVVMDEKGRFAISLLSGHLGGANKLAEAVAAETGGIPVITTATDVNEVIAFDMFAAQNGCMIENIRELKWISAELVNGGKVGLYSDYKIQGQIPGNIVLTDPEGNQELQCFVVLSNRMEIHPSSRKVLYLRPKNLILGIGCKRGTTEDQIACAVDEFMKMNGRSVLSLKCAATIDLKKDETGILNFCRSQGLDLVIVQRSEIEGMEEKFTYSEFVKSQVGVGSVAEPCAVLGGKNTRLICKKTAYKGITLALSEEEKEFTL